MFGILRVYSLLDLTWMLLACGVGRSQAAGSLLLWVGFLYCLEAVHRHPYRKRVHPLEPLSLAFVGALLYVNTEADFTAVIAFCVASALYVNKNRKPFGYVSPLARGAQNFFLVGGAVGYGWFTWLVFGLVALRNFVGDLRDISRDRSEGIRTLPVAFGWKKDKPSWHLLAVVVTTFLWWYRWGGHDRGALSWALFFATVVVQVASYHFTPRKVVEASRTQA